jgi:hypothetical protein
MAHDRLYAILTFTAVPISGTATLAHGLILRDTPVTPDLVLLQYPDSFELVSADDTNVTIRNTANSGGSCLAWVDAIHPAIRLLGLQPDDGTMLEGLVPRPYAPGSPNSGGAAVTGSYVVVFQPGGVATENVVTSWADVMTRLALLKGTRVLQFDDSFTSPIVIPVGGPYDMTGVTWSPIPDRISQVEVPEGVTFTHLRDFDGRIHVTFTGTTAPVADFGQGPPQLDTLTLDHAAEIRSTGAGPFFSIGGDTVVRLGDEAELLFSTHAVLDISAAVSVGIFAEGSLVSVVDSSISGIVGSTLILTTANDALNVLSESQPAFLGTLTVTNDTRTRSFPSAVFTTTLGMTSVFPTLLTLVNPTGGAFTATLPAAAGLRGQTIRIKNTTASTNNVTLAAAGGDTIDGAATVVLSGDHFFFAVTSDGVHTWYVTGR